MAFSRYRTDRTTRRGRLLPTTTGASRLWRAVAEGRVSVERYTLSEGERLDTIAYKAYGDDAYWWVIAYASGIGWPLQVPSGQTVYVPRDLEEVRVAIGV